MRNRLASDFNSRTCADGDSPRASFLALAGDLGATISPTMVGYISELANGNLKAKAGLLVASAFPILLVISLIRIKRAKSPAPVAGRQ